MTTTEGALTWLYVSPSLNETTLFSCAGLDSLTERDRVKIDLPMLSSEPLRRQISHARPDGVVFEMGRGWPGRHQLIASARLLRDHRVVFYWPREAAAEVVDVPRLGSYWALWLRAKAYTRTHRAPVPEGDDLSLVSAPEPEVHAEVEVRAKELLASPRPAHLGPLRDGRIPGWGAYLRTDFWAPIETGGSYGHTCYVAKELAGITDNFVCLMANRFPLLDELGVRQVVLTAHSREGNESALIAASPTCNLQLRALLETLHPSYIYERLCLGNLSGAQLSRELEIPYIVEYNGSENSIRQSFGQGAYTNAALFDLIEDAAFAQASVISVVSSAIASSLVARGVDENKILVNPNGADPDAYRPATADERSTVRVELGVPASSTVVGFIGTFGGWHGVDVLAQAIPIVLERSPSVVFLLIGDGTGRPAFAKAVQEGVLAKRVLMTGRVPHTEGPRLLRACDIFVSPHASHMVDSPFFGSPTKLFEYMAMGKAVVASDLEQIGEVLRPAFTPLELLETKRAVGSERAVLCRPGDAPDLATAICALAAQPELADALGHNAREALTHDFTWYQHVKRLADFATGSGPPPKRRDFARSSFDHGSRSSSKSAQVLQGEAGPDRPTGTIIGTVPDEHATTSYKNEVVRQWDADPCGSHYVSGPNTHTLEWFEAASRYRYHDYAPWMPKVMEFSGWYDKDVLEVGAGIGTDLAQFALNGARTTDCDMSSGHLQLAAENFSLRGLKANFVHADAEALPLRDESYDLVYSNGVVHHTPGTRQAVNEIYRVLRPGGRAIVMVYAEMSLHYWRMLVGEAGLRRGLLEDLSIGEIMSRTVELSTTDARPLVKTYTSMRLRALFAQFANVRIRKYQLTDAERPSGPLKLIPAPLLGRVMGWNLIVKADKAN